MVSMAIPLWAWHWLWALPQHRLSTRWEPPQPFQVNPVCVCVQTNLGLSRLSGAVQDVSGQRQPRRSGPLPFNHGLLQPYLHLLRAPHSLFHQGGALGLSVITALGIHVWTGRTVAGWDCTQEDDGRGKSFKRYRLRLWLFSNLRLKFLFQCSTSWSMWVWC